MALLGLDLGINRTGFCVGDGSTVPLASALRYEPVGEHFGALGVPFKRDLIRLIGDHGVERVIYEAPLKLRHDSMLTLRKIYGMGFLLETACAEIGVPCREEDPKPVKLELTGTRKADKDAMVLAARRAGISLPRTKADGMEDAADAFAVWLVAVRLYAKQHLPLWDQRIHGRAFTLRGQ